MKIELKNPCQILALLMAVLAFSTPFVTFAQQNSAQPEDGVATEYDTKSATPEVKAAAEQDASNDVNKFFWFIAGATVPALAYSGALAGCLVAYIIDPPSLATEQSDLYGCAIPTGISGGESADVATLIGLAVGVLVPLNWIRNYKPNIPPYRFIGKSPEYIDFYTAAYNKKARWLRLKWAAAGVTGCVTAVTATSTLFLIWLAEVSEEN